MGKVGPSTPFGGWLIKYDGPLKCNHARKKNEYLLIPEETEAQRC